MTFCSFAFEAHGFRSIGPEHVNCQSIYRWLNAEVFGEPFDQGQQYTACWARFGSQATHLHEAFQHKRTQDNLSDPQIRDVHPIQADVLELETWEVPNFGDEGLSQQSVSHERLMRNARHAPPGSLQGRVSPIETAAIGRALEANALTCTPLRPPLQIKSLFEPRPIASHLQTSASQPQFAA